MTFYVFRLAFSLQDAFFSSLSGVARSSRFARRVHDDARSDHPRHERPAVQLATWRFRPLRPSPWVAPNFSSASRRQWPASDASYARPMASSTAAISASVVCWAARR